MYPSGRQLHANCTQMAAAHANCTRVAASRMQISVDFIHVACDWQPLGHNLNATGRYSRMLFLHATGGHPDTICLRLAARRTLFQYNALFFLFFPCSFNNLKSDTRLLFSSLQRFI